MKLQSQAITKFVAKFCHLKNMLNNTPKFSELYMAIDISALNEFVYNTFLLFSKLQGWGEYVKHTHYFNFLFLMHVDGRILEKLGDPLASNDQKSIRYIC